MTAEVTERLSEAGEKALSPWKAAFTEPCLIHSKCPVSENQFLEENNYISFEARSLLWT